MRCIDLRSSLIVASLIALPAHAADLEKLFEVSYAQAEESVGLALSDKGAGEKVAATIGGDDGQPFFSYGSPVTVETRGLQFDRQSRRWSASLLFVDGKEVVSALPASGRYEELTELPVLRREVRAGNVIAAADVELRDYPLSRSRSDTVTDLASLIGKSPLRTISANRPIREHEIAAAPIVKKNGMVEIRYSSPGMLITATGEAMGEGAKGDVISVRNTASKKILRAVVEDQHTVSILAPGGSYAAN